MTEGVAIAFAGLVSVGTGAYALHAATDKRALVRLVRAKMKWTRMPLALEQATAFVVGVGFVLLGLCMFFGGVMLLLP